MVGGGDQALKERACNVQVKNGNPGFDAGAKGKKAEVAKPAGKRVGIGFITGER